MRFRAVAFPVAVAAAVAGFLASAAHADQPGDPSKPCDLSESAGFAGGASVEAVRAGFQKKNWQPPGGDLDLTLRFPGDHKNARFFVCFRWRTEESQKYKPGEVTNVVESPDGTVKVSTSVPTDLGGPPADVLRTVHIVPLADVRVIVQRAEGADAGKVVADASTTIGVTNVPKAIIATLVITGIVFAVLLVFVKRRITRTAVLTANPILAMITGKDGNASLSQFQVLLWTFVVGASAIYVMILSGNLMTISNGTLVLLGISGAAALAAKAKAENEAAKKSVDESSQLAQGGPAPQTPVDKVAEAGANLTARQAEETVARSDAAGAQKVAGDAAKAAANAPDDAAAAAAAAQAATNAAVKDAMLAAKTDATRAAINALNLARRLAAPHAPAWSDLVMSLDGTSEIDITRLQMLFFTVIAAAFVLLTVLANYVIPEIPDGFDILIAISNAVYVGNKVVSQ